MQNSDYVFGDVGLPDDGGYEIRGAELSHHVVKKPRFVKAMQDYDIDQEKGQKIWDWLSKKTDEKFDAHRLSQSEPEPMTWEKLAELELDTSEWHEFARSIDLASEVAEKLVQDYEYEVRGLIEKQIEAREEAEQAQAEAEAEEAEAGEEDLSDEVLDQLIDEIRNDPAYYDENASQQDHDRAVNALNKALQMRAGLIPRTMADIEGYAREYKAEQEQVLREQYGVGDVYKTGEGSSSNGVPADQSFAGVDGDADGIAQDEHGDDEE
nr:hypothetical protein 19 [bacterium]